MDIKLSVGRSGVVLLLLLAIFCCQCPETTCTWVPSKYLVYYFMCLEPCTKDLRSCLAHCRKSNTCEASRKFCTDLCAKVWNICEEKCEDETRRRRAADTE
ncbi:hypothetical protein LSAT2_021402 [Lamellibrachia satsuma]|nr:hypothetical protein LSAT2_021402 [Lamellibrachia satsuma]